MDDLDYAVAHFRWMVAFSESLRSLPAEILEHRYQYDAFGSWSTVVRFKGDALLVDYDGKECEYRLTWSPIVRYGPYKWGNEVWSQRRDSDPLAPTDLIEAIQSVEHLRPRSRA